MSLYRLITSKEERQKYRTKIQKQIADKRKLIRQKSSESQLQSRLRSSGLPISAFSFQIIRWSFVLVVSAYYIIIPLVEGNFKITLLCIPPLLIILTEPVFKHSIVNKVLDLLINRKRRQRIIEMFQLFDVLKAELLSLKPNQEVNIYYILKDSLPTFEHISGTISKFLSFWKTSPEKAKNVFLNDIGGDSAKALGDILEKMDRTTKQDALKILESESKVFSYQYYERELQQSGKQRLVFYIFFMSTNILIISWLIVLVLSMFNSTINQIN